MKKIIASLMTLALMAAVLAGCSSNSSTASSDTTDASDARQTEIQAETETEPDEPQNKPEQPEQTQIEKALALINTFATGDTETAKSLLAEGCIQHNLAYGTGRDAFIGSVEYLASAETKTTVENVRAFEDGDKVFLQTVYNFAGAGEQAAFDIFRFDENGLIAEHWDVMETIAEESTWQNENGKF